MTPRNETLSPFEPRARRRAGRIFPALALILALPALAQDEPAADSDAEVETAKWRDTAELTFLRTGGNSEATTLGFRNKLERVWPEALLTVEAAGVRAEDTNTTRIAVLEPSGDVRIDERSETMLTAESYSLEGRYDRELTERLFWFVGGGWNRNEFAGIQNRYYATAGVGNVWFESDEAAFRTHYGATFTEEEDLSGISDSFVGARLAYDYFRQVTDSTRFSSKLIVDENLDDTSDLRADFTNSLAVAMSSRLALKVSLQLLYDGRPSLTDVAIVDLAGTPTGDVVRVELDELDSVFNVSLVVNF